MQRVDIRSVVAHTFVSVLLFLGPIALFVTGATLGGWLTVPLWLAQTVGLLGLSNAAHECVHGHYLRRRHVDRWAGRLFHLPVLVNYEAHRIYHLGHHAHTGDHEDPEGSFDYRDIPTFGRYLLKLGRWMVPPSPLHVVNQRIAWRAIAGPRDATRRRVVANELLVIGAIAAMVALTVLTAPLLLLQAYWIPALVVFPAAAFWTAVPEHFGLEGEASAFGHTRTILLPAWASWLLWNINYHTAHHARPNTPFHNLHRLHEELGPQVVHVTAGYVSFHRHLLRRGRTSHAEPGATARAR